MQSRKDKVLKAAAICLLSYIVALFISSNNTIIRDYLFTLPGYALMSYGCYCLISIGRSTEKINENKDEFIQLQKEIKEARKFIEANDLS